MNDDFVEAYSVTTGVKQTVPRLWLEPGFTFGRDFRKTPLQIAADAAAGERPSNDWTKPQLEEWAARERVELGDAKVKADVWAAIEAVLAAGDAEMVTAATPPAAPSGVDTAPYAAELTAATARIADLETQLAGLQLAVADGASAGAADGQGTPDPDVTPTPDSNTPTSTTENPGNGEEEN